MKDTGHRLTYSWTDINRCTITDATTGDYLRLDATQDHYSGDLDEYLAIDGLMNIVEVLNTYPTTKKWGLQNPTDYKDNVVIRDVAHLEWDFVENDHYATAKDGRMTVNSKFDTGRVLNRVYNTVNLLNNATSRLHPKTDIVRRIADCNLLVWVNEGRCIAVAEKNIDGMSMQDALVDGIYYPSLLVDASREKDLCSVYDIDTGELIFCCPLDNSITTYFTPGEDLLKQKED